MGDVHSVSRGEVTFEIESAAAGVPVPHAVERILFTSDPGELSEASPTLEKLDVTIVALKSLPAKVSGLKPAANVPLPSPKTKAFVVGHPSSPRAAVPPSTTASCWTSPTTSA